MTDKLMELHANDVKELMTRIDLDKDIDGVAIDELFMLRFLLSAKGEIDLAEKRIRSALEWRKQNRNELIDIRNGGKHKLENQIREHFLSGYTGKLETGEPINVVRLGLSDCKTLMSKFSVEDVASILTAEKERLFQMCDEETRRTGTIVKAITIIDFAGFSMWGGKFDKRILNALGSSSKTTSAFYPQLQGKTIMINTPSYYNIIHKGLAAVMPKASMEKMVICSGNKKKVCPFITRYNVNEALPIFLGGNIETPIELMPFNERPQELIEINKNNDDETPAVVETVEVTIPSRAFAILKIPQLEQNTVVDFQAQLESKHVKLSAFVEPRQIDTTMFQAANPQSPKATTQTFQKTKSPISLRRYRVKSTDEYSTSPTNNTNINSTKRERASSIISKTSSDDSDSEQDFGDRINWKSIDKSMVPIRIDARGGILKASWMIPTNGDLIFQFDNTFSKWRSKKLKFTYQATSPKTKIDIQLPKRKVSKSLPTKTKSSNYAAQNLFLFAILIIAQLLILSNFLHVK